MHLSVNLCPGSLLRITTKSGAVLTEDDVAQILIDPYFPTKRAVANVFSCQAVGPNGVVDRCTLAVSGVSGAITKRDIDNHRAVPSFEQPDQITTAANGPAEE